VESELIHFLLQRIGGRESALFIAPMNAYDLSRAFEDVLTTHGNLYPLLQQRGFRAISPAVIVNDGVLLSGGSYSSVLLRVREGKANIYKRIEKPLKEENVDTDMRLLHERAWLKALPESAARLFPQLKCFLDDEKAFGYETEFIPACSAAELVFQGCMNGKQLFAVLREVYLALCRHMYCLPSIKLVNLPDETGYLERIERRTQAILKSCYPPDGILRTLYNAQQIRVNGVQCPSLPALLDHLRFNREWRSVVAPSGYGGTVCQDSFWAKIRQNSTVRETHSSLFRYTCAGV